MVWIVDPDKGLVNPAKRCLHCKEEIEVVAGSRVEKLFWLCSIEDCIRATSSSWNAAVYFCDCMTIGWCEDCYDKGSSCL